MIKKVLISCMKFIVEFIIFPISRWHRANYFLFKRSDLKLKDKPSILWLIFGWPFTLVSRVAAKFHNLYQEATIRKYSELMKKHYLENYAYDKKYIFTDEYARNFLAAKGSISELMNNESLLKILNIEKNDSFLDCGCGDGLNIKEILQYLPQAKAIGFDLSPNAIEFARTMFTDKDIELFQGSILDIEVFKKFPDSSIDNVLFANVLGTIMSKTIDQTRMTRSAIIREAVRIARKNVILNEIFTNQTNIFIEQKFRSIFNENYAKYFESFKNQGHIFATPQAVIFTKTLTSQLIEQKL